MSRKIFINNLNTFVSKALLEELKLSQKGEDGEENPDAATIYGSYIDKDSSEKPGGVKKMLKRSKPRLAMKYLAGCDLIVFDLHSGNPTDVRVALEALRKHKVEEDKTLILISSLMAWKGTPEKREEIKTADQMAKEAAEAKTVGKEEVDPEAVAAEANDSDAGEPEDDEDGAEVDKDSFEEFKEKVAPVKERKRYRQLPFTELDYVRRNPVEEYQIIKEIEEEVLNFKKEFVKTYVISAGVLYGRGEAIFNSHIQKAWLQDPVRLPYVGDGNNILPTIHVTDLARMVFKIYEKKPERQYIFAVDNNKKQSQKKLIKAISNGIGTGLIESQDIPEVFKKAHPKLTPIQLDLDWRKSLLLNLKVTPSSLFIEAEKPIVQEGGAEALEEGEVEAEIIEMNWHCKDGMAANINLVKDEFARARGLRPIKILIAGPPCSGKTFFGGQLGEHYNVPHIHMEKLLTDLESWDQEKEDNYNKRQAERERLRDQIRAEREAEKQRLQAEQAEEERVRRESNAEDDDDAADEPEEKDDDNSAKEGGVEGDAEDGAGKAPTEHPTTPEVEPLPALDGDSDDDFSLIEIKQKVKDFQADNEGERIPTNLINEAVRWRLNRNDCQNRGYVLDGYPKDAQSAEDVFKITPVKKEKKVEEGEEDEEPAVDEEEEAANLKPVLQKNIYPESVISLNASALFLKRRSLALQKESADSAAKWQRERLGPKLEAYNKANSIDLFREAEGADATYPTTKFFQDNKTEVFEMSAVGDKYEIFESMRIYIERFGRPYNYLKSVKELNQEREHHLIEEESEAKAGKGAVAQEEKQKLETQKAALEKLFEKRLSEVRAHMAELTECDDLNMRQFLMKYIIPVLTEGMIDVWKAGPLDPVDYLADYILKRSNGT